MTNNPRDSLLVGLFYVCPKFEPFPEKPTPGDLNCLWGVSLYYPAVIHQVADWIGVKPESDRHFGLRQGGRNALGVGCRNINNHNFMTPWLVWMIL
ncbi:hypothetical protein SAMN04487895_104202 [Paenibacillus sophorae]|uniref:Uncharacterized protein n=1 Tax=Paenibacillus sophorae TaxID=1333845 RepID=A0A1H8L6P9_9BACL|nr:hypothetical protein SAMN04487895_104202 [Paenibacillus sophorae]